MSRLEAGTGPATSGAAAGPEAVAGGATRHLTRALAVVAFAALTALAARAAVPLPGTAVPFTLQVVAVLAAGFLLGPRLGAASQALYVAAGAAGLPVFAAGGGAAYLLGPTGGYLLAFPLAAALAGLAVRRFGGVVGLTAGGVLGVAVVHAGGLAWLAGTLGGEAALAAGVLPFLAGDAVKIALAVLLGLGLRERVLRLLA